MFVAIMAVDQNSRVTKYADFLTEAKADAHIVLAEVLFPGKFPDAFVAPEPAAALADWLIDVAAKSISIVPLPPPDFGVIDTATVDRLLLESGVLRALAKALFAVVNDVRVLEGSSPVTADQFKTYLKGLIR